MNEQNNMLIEPDFSEVPDAVGPGTYRVRIINGEVGKWEGRDGKPDTNYINWRLETFGDTVAKNNGRAIFHRTPINGKGAFRLKDFYKAATGEELTGKFDINMLYGREVEITYGPQKDRPEYSEVKTVKAITH